MFQPHSFPPPLREFRLPVFLLACTCCVVGSAATAASVEGALEVRLQLESGCELIFDGSDGALLDFGRFAGTEPNTSDAARSLAVLRVACSSSYVGANAPVLNVGAGLHARDSQRYLLGPGAERIAYDLYADPAHRVALQPGVPTQLSLPMAGTATPVPIYGEVPRMEDPAAGLYTDVVSLTLSY